MRILSLDLSFKTGYAILEGEMGDQKPTLIKYGTVEYGQTARDAAPYPWCYKVASTEMAEKIFTEIENAIGDLKIDAIVIEEINLGRSRWTQKVLENIHRSVLDVLYITGAKVVYIDTSEWRSKMQIQMSAEQRRLNAKLSKAKSAAKRSGKKLDKKKLGIAGKITKKHLAVAKVNEMYGLSLKISANDACEAILLGAAFLRNAVPCTGE